MISGDYADLLKGQKNDEMCDREPELQCKDCDNEECKEGKLKEAEDVMTKKQDLISAIKDNDPIIAQMALTAFIEKMPENDVWVIAEIVLDEVVEYQKQQKDIDQRTYCKACDMDTRDCKILGGIGDVPILENEGGHHANWHNKSECPFCQKLLIVNPEEAT